MDKWGMHTKTFRKWLNPASSSYARSHVVVQADVDQWKCSDGETGRHYNCDLSLADCYRKVTLDFSYRDRKERDAMVKKLGIIDQALDVVREHLGRIDDEPL